MYLKIVVLLAPSRLRHEQVVQQNANQMSQILHLHVCADKMWQNIGVQKILRRRHRTLCCWFVCLVREMLRNASCWVNASEHKHMCICIGRTARASAWSRTMDVTTGIQSI